MVRSVMILLSVSLSWVTFPVAAGEDSIQGWTETLSLPWAEWSSKASSYGNYIVAPSRVDERYGLERGSPEIRRLAGVLKLKVMCLTDSHSYGLRNHEE